jgi:pimeloyl-ACP methyl ester carboxylesterase
VLLLHPWVVWGKAYFHRWGRIEALRAAGYHVLTPDLPGFGGSGKRTGFPDRDVETCLAELRRLSGDLPLHLWGVSAGGYWAHPVLARTREVAGAVFEDVSPHLLEWSWRLAPWGRPFYLFFRHVLRGAYRFLDVRRHAAAMDLAHVLYVSGSEDRGVRPDDTAELARKAGGDFLIIDGAGHLGAIKVANDEVLDWALDTFEQAERRITGPTRVRGDEAFLVFQDLIEKGRGPRIVRFGETEDGLSADLPVAVLAGDPDEMGDPFPFGQLGQGKDRLLADLFVGILFERGENDRQSRGLASLGEPEERLPAQLRDVARRSEIGEGGIGAGVAVEGDRPGCVLAQLRLLRAVALSHFMQPGHALRRIDAGQVDGAHRTEVDGTVAGDRPDATHLAAREAGEHLEVAVGLGETAPFRAARALLLPFEPAGGRLPVSGEAAGVALPRHRRDRPGDPHRRAYTGHFLHGGTQ